ncbi:group III truncated hemoglobin [Aureibacter tunicatorum]|uniref:Hemoglobin n=1 Tax=Aureibacter tunicatorum TaxID=866807 RepID=A0AAE3XJD9_9BACT|nr:group III truncated hemoglobin [Aureibacter tunicatorum]MDR6237224.1 hemoglobin [Aureibacter tunicatorum]BDD06216.1 hypothetical protein AUTU_36990 [Aureibacter tunicatorum]
MKMDVQCREDIDFLIRKFYSRVRKDELLGPIFNEVIDDWDKHMDHIADFWESSIFHVGKFKGNPMAKHMEVDQKADHSITQNHFGRWLQLWFTTLEEDFEGENTRLLKERARNMASIMFIRIFEARKKRP